MLLVTESDPADSVPTTPSGWTLIGNSSTGTAPGTPATQTRLTVWYKYAVSGESAPTVTSPGNHVFAGIFSFWNVRLSSPYDVTPTTSNTGTSVPTTVSFPSITTTSSENLLVQIVASGWDVTTAGFFNADYANSNFDGDFSWRFGATNSLANGGGFGLYTGVLPTAGASGTSTCTIDSAAQQARMTIALVPEQPGCRLGFLQPAY